MDISAIAPPAVPADQESRAQAAEVWAWLAFLTPRQRQVLEALLLGYSLSEAAVWLGITPQRAWEVKQFAMARIRFKLRIRDGNRSRFLDRVRPKAL